MLSADAGEGQRHWLSWSWSQQVVVNCQTCGLGTNSDPHQEQQALLGAEPSLQPRPAFLFTRWLLSDK